ncbi:MAG: hypothetical protein H0U59_03305 [Gemmatimonadaceae bacterium]|nr:hypothetical protein [Gemmatimonadaceae bacterium]
MSERPVIGDFRSKSDNAVRQTAATPATPAAVTTPATPAPATDATKSDAPEVPLTPKERYEQLLVEEQIPRHIANAIFDAVMEKGYYEEYASIGKHRVVLRTRLYEDQLRLNAALEATRPSLIINQDDMITRYNLAASLYEWKGVKYPHANDDDFDAVMDMLKKQPGPVINLLTQAIQKFDRKVFVIFSDGAAESF